MYSVSNAFKTALNQSAYKIRATVTDGVTTLTESDDLINFKINTAGNLCRTVMRQLDVQYLGSHDLLGQTINPKLGVIVAGSPIITDNFNGELDLTTKWTRTNSAQVFLANRRLNLKTLLAGNYVSLQSIPTGDFTQNYAYATLVDAGNQALASLEVYPVFIEKDANNSFFWLVTGNSIQAYRRVAGVNTQLSTEAYSSANHKVFRIWTNGAGDVAFDVSADGITWVNKANTTTDFDVTTVYQKVEVGTWDAEASITTVIIDNINTPSAYVDDVNTEYLDFGSFTVVESVLLDDKETTRVRAYDKMDEANIPYDLDDAETYPKTVKQFLEAICTRLGWTLATTTFANDSLSIANEKYSTLQMSFREVLEDIAEATASIMYFGNDDQLYLREISDTVLETLDLTQLVAPITIKKEYGELNSLVLARAPQEDNIVQQDAGSIATYGLNEFRITNNWLVDDDRVTAITDIYNALLGIKYHPHEINTTGRGYYEIGDRIKVTTLDATEYEVLILGIELEVGAGIIERLRADVPDKTTTNYQNAGIIGRTIKNTEIKVDKQQGEIDLLVAQMAETLALPRQSTPPVSPSTNDLYLDTDDNIIYIYDGADWQPTSISPSVLDGYYTKDETLTEISLTADTITASVVEAHTLAQNTKDQTDALASIVNEKVDSTTLTQTVNDILAQIQKVGGVNLLKNSAGLKGTIEEWLDGTNDATVDQTSDTQINTTAQSGIKVENNYITQTVPTIIGNQYTFYCRFRKDCTTNVTITGLGTAEITEDGYTNDTWGTYKVPFTATNSNTEVKIENSTVGGYAILGDMVVKIGDCDAWQPAPKEVYGSTYRFGIDGLYMSDLNSKFVAVLDNDNLIIYDTTTSPATVVAQFSIDTALITKPILQDTITLRQYNSTVKNSRFIATDTGFMIVVND